MTLSLPPDPDEIERLEAVSRQLDANARRERAAGYGAPKARRLRLPRASDAFGEADAHGYAGIILMGLGLGYWINIGIGVAVVGLLLIGMGLMLGATEPPEPKR